MSDEELITMPCAICQAPIEVERATKNTIDLACAVDGTVLMCVMCLVSEYHKKHVKNP